MEIATFMDNSTVEDVSPDHVVRNMVMSTLLISITTLVIAMCASWKLCQQQRKLQTREYTLHIFLTVRSSRREPKTRQTMYSYIHREEDSTQDGTAGQSQVQSRNRDNTRDVKYVARRKSSLSSRK
eukprot:4820525-Amphidinium_carterae.2